MSPLRGWTRVLSEFYKHAIPSGLHPSLVHRFYKHAVPSGLRLAVLFLLLPLVATADDLIVTNETPAFVLDTRLPASDPGPGSLIVQAETPSFTLDTRLPTGDPGPGSLIVQFESPPFVLDTRLPATDPGPGALIVQAESPPFTLDTRLPDGIVPSSGTVVTESGPFTLDTRLPDGIVPSSGTTLAESGPFTLDTRLPDGISFTNAVATVESPPFTLDTRLPDGISFTNAVLIAESSPFPLDTRLTAAAITFPNVITQTESSPFTLDTRIPPLDVWWITTAESGPFTLDTLSGWFNTPAQTLIGGSTSGKARFAPDGLRLAKTDGSRVLLWNLQSTRTNFLFTGHAAEVATVEFSPLGDQLLTGSADGTMRWWDTASRNELGRTNPPGAGTAYAAYASDGARILAGRGTNVSLYRVPTMELMQEFSGSEGSITALALAPEGLALAGNSSRFALVWDTATGAILHRLTNHTGLITAAAFFPGGTNAMTASIDGTIRIWDTATGAEVLCIQQTSPVGDAVLSEDGRLIVSCKYDAAPNHGGWAFLWDAHSGAFLRVFSDGLNNSSAIRAVALSPDQTVLATTYDDGSVCLWNTGLDPRPIYPITPLPIGTNIPVTIRSHGLYYFELDAEAGHSVVVTLEADTGGGGSKLRRTAKGLASIACGLCADAEFANLGAAAPRNLSAQSLQSPPPGADITAFRMTATQGHLPSVYDYESFAQASITNLHCEMPMAFTSSNKAYVLVFSPYLAAGSINARISAVYDDFHLSNISPAQGGNVGNVTVEIQGTGLDYDTEVTLVTQTTNIVGYVSDITETTRAVTTFDLNGVPLGLYDLVLSNRDGRMVTLALGFEVLAGHGGSLAMSLSGPSSVRFGRLHSRA